MELVAHGARWLLALPFLVLLQGCSGGSQNQSAFVARLDAACSGVTGQQVLRLAAVTDFDWDQVLILAPYTGREVVDRALGGPAPDMVRALGIDARDDVNGFVFLRGGSVTKAYAVPRAVMEPEIQGGPARFSRDAAVFRRRGSSRSFAPVDAAGAAAAPPAGSG